MFLLRIIDIKVKKVSKGLCLERRVYGSGTCTIGITKEKKDYCRFTHGATGGC